MRIFGGLELGLGFGGGLKLWEGIGILFGFDFGVNLILILNISICVGKRENFWDLTSLTCILVSIFLFF
jgi:hypothetical protein